MIRDYKGVGLDSLSRETGLSIDWLEKVEAKAHDPTLVQAEMLGRALGVHQLSITGPIFDCEVLSPTLTRVPANRG